jgi:acetolactate decarboxylase
MAHMMKTRQILISTLLIGAFCGAAWAATAAFKVEWKGALRDTHAGDTSGKVRLAELPRSPQLYAVGPVSGLGGEITIIDGQLLLAKAEDGKLKTSSDYDGEASFLVWGTVPQWRNPVPLGVSAASHSAVEKAIEAKAREAGLDVDKPFPFLLRGTFGSVKFHVVIPASTQGGHTGSGSPADSALNLQANGKSGTIVGFFSKKHEGVFTHGGSHAHLHIALGNGDSGHIDELAVGPEVQLLLPRT